VKVENSGQLPNKAMHLTALRAAGDRQALDERATPVATDKFLVHCDVSGREFQFGPHRYEGRRNQTYEIMVCSTCHEANWDGWAPHCEERVTRRLIEQGLAMPARNAKGWLPRE
jgi:hypothetical protein